MSLWSPAQTREESHNTSFEGEKGVLTSLWWWVRRHCNPLGGMLEHFVPAPEMGKPKFALN